MLIFDQLKKHDPHLKVVGLLILSGLLALLGGLWWTQIVSSRDYQANLEMQSFRTVRIPAVRGKILDRNGAVLAENRPSYNVSLFLEELRAPLSAAYSNEVARLRAELKQKLDAQETQTKRKLTKEERKQFVVTSKDRVILRQRASCRVASNVVAQVSQRLGQPLSLDVTNFL